MSVTSGTIDMQTMRYINLFGKVSHVSTTKCFVYNGSIYFVVLKGMVSKAVGKDGANVKKLSQILRKKIKVIPMPKSSGDIAGFVKAVVDPITFNKVDVKDGEVIISAGRQSKAALIGRRRIREKELEGILKNFFQIKKLRIA